MNDEKTLLQEEEVKQPETDVNDLGNKCNVAIARVEGFTEGYADGYYDGKSSSLKEWYKGFFAGIGAIGTGFALGNVILVLINKKKK